jgi:TM2 domain-containing membrane protein YozV
MTDQQQPWGAPVPPPPAGYGQPSGSYGPPAVPPYATPAAPAYGQPMAPAYGQPMGAPYGYSDKSKTAAGLLQLLLSLIGIPGVGRLYTGHIGLGLGQLVGMIIGYLLLLFLVGFLIVPAFWIWGVVDGIVMLVGDPKDAQGRPLRP